MCIGQAGDLLSIASTVRHHLLACTSVKPLTWCVITSLHVPASNHSHGASSPPCMYQRQTTHMVRHHLLACTSVKPFTWMPCSCTPRVLVHAACAHPAHAPTTLLAQPVACAGDIPFLSMVPEVWHAVGICRLRFTNSIVAVSAPPKHSRYAS